MPLWKTATANTFTYLLAFGDFTDILSTAVYDAFINIIKMSDAQRDSKRLAV
jgi:hypothetical protein